MSRAAKILAIVIAIVASALSTRAAHAATIRSLPLPTGFTIAPEADHRLMTFGPNGTVYAVVKTIDVRGRTRALRWRAGRFEVFAPIPQPYDDQGFSAPRVETVAPGRDTTYVTVGRTHDGAYIGTEFTTDRWIGNVTRRWVLPPCGELGFGAPHVFASDGERIALTMDPSANSTGIDLANPKAVEESLPWAAILQGNHCTELGSAIVTALRGRFAAGYIGLLDGKPAPWSINLMVQKMIAKRWLAGREEKLGPGTPFATTSDGVVVGASALPGHAKEWVYGNFFGPPGRYEFATPHAALWPRKGERVILLRGDARSVAWDVNDAGTVVGMLQKPNGRHYAFRRTNGHVDLLDDLPHERGWRFESAYAIAPDGSIAGIGTYDGIATAFVWRLT